MSACSDCSIFGRSALRSATETVIYEVSTASCYTDIQPFLSRHRAGETTFGAVADVRIVAPQGPMTGATMPLSGMGRLS